MIEQYHPIYGEAEAKAVYDLIKSGSWLSEFEKTKEFERQLGLLCDAPYVSCVNNGTIALSLALMSRYYPHTDFVRNCKVLIPNITMIATATACEFIGAEVVFCDIDMFGCLDADKALSMLKKDRSITDVIYVTLNGQMNSKSVLALKKYCEEHNIGFIKDDAQSLGSRTEYNDTLQNKLFGNIHTISFSPHKLVSCGQGGAIVTHDKETYETIERLKDFGRLDGIGGDKHDYYGINSKFSEIQATLGLVQLKDINYKINKKKYIYEMYHVNLKSCNGCLMLNTSFNSVPWFVNIFVDDRDNLIKYLKDNGIQTRAMYPMLSEQRIYKDYDSHIDYPNSRIFAEKGLWLPSSLDLRDEDILKVCMKIKEFYECKK